MPTALARRAEASLLAEARPGGAAAPREGDEGSAALLALGDTVEGALALNGQIRNMDAAQLVPDGTAETLAAACLAIAAIADPDVIVVAGITPALHRSTVDAASRSPVWIASGRAAIRLALCGDVTPVRFVPRAIQTELCALTLEQPAAADVGRAGLLR